MCSIMIKLCISVVVGVIIRDRKDMNSYLLNFHVLACESGVSKAKANSNCKIYSSDPRYKPFLSILNDRFRDKSV